MFKSIIIPVDTFTKEAGRQANGLVEQFAKDGAQLTFVQVVPQGPRVMARSDDDQVETRLKEAVASTGIAARIAVLRGDPVAAILDYARDEGADCILVPEIRRGIGSWLFGSPAARIARAAPCTVVVGR